MSQQGDRSKELSSFSTAHLLNEAKAGSSGARDALVARYLPWLQKWARGRLPDSVRETLPTDDIVQDMLVQAVQQLEAFQPEGNAAFRAYLRRTTRGWIVGELDRLSQNPPADGSGDLARPGPSPLEAAIGKERVASYEAALERLEPGEQEAIVARLEDGESYAAIGQELGIDEDAARRLAKSALFRLAREMARSPRSRT